MSAGKNFGLDQFAFIIGKLSFFRWLKAVDEKRKSIPKGLFFVMKNHTKDII